MGPMHQQAVLGDETLQAAAELLRAAGLGGSFAVQPLRGGANNKVFRIDAGGKAVLLKAYFQHPKDRRDRLEAEYAFSTFAWENGLRSLPQPLARDVRNRLGLYEFVEGRQLLPEEVGDDVVQQALTFLSELNRHRHLLVAQRLPTASEACFSIAGHLQCVQGRLHALRGILGSSVGDREAADFVRDELSEVWRDTAGAVESEARRLGLVPQAELTRTQWRLSPSDFGFHNAIRTASGRLRFIDFEYAGWDDPAKTVCDFFCQVSVPVPLAYFDTVLDTVAEGVAEPELFRVRTRLLLPVYRLKWCCIVLNDFLPVDGSRRRFAHTAEDQEARKVQQLRKARRALERLTSREGTHGVH